MHQMSQKEIAPLREELLKKNDGVCPLCTTKIDQGNEALDHCHDTGQIRNTICKQCNSLEGQMKSKWVRSGVAKKVPFAEYLYNLSQYLNPDLYLPILHPSCKPGPRKLMKSSYNRLLREVTHCNEYLKRPIKVPDYPKSKRLTKKLKELYEKYGIEPKYYGAK